MAQTPRQHSNTERTDRGFRGQIERTGVEEIQPFPSFLATFQIPDGQLLFKV